MKSSACVSTELRSQPWLESSGWRGAPSHAGLNRRPHTLSGSMIGCSGVSSSMNFRPTRSGPLFKTAVLNLARANPDGISNADTASLLGLRSDYRGSQKDYLSYSVPGLLMREGKVKRRNGKSPRHVVEGALGE